MTSSKGKPTDPKLRENVKEEIKNKPNSDGSGKGQWAAWKANQLSKEYEKRGGGYENEDGSKNEPKKGTPEPKSNSKKKRELKEANNTGEDEDELHENGTTKSDKENHGPNKQKEKKTSSKNPAANKQLNGKSKNAPREGSRKSLRQREKRKAELNEDGPSKKANKAAK